MMLDKLTQHKQMIKRVIKIVVVLYAGFFLMNSCGNTGQSLSGVVTDAETGKPIEGAIVTASWVGVVSLIVDSQTQCYWAEGTTTDKNGEFHFSRWWSLKGWAPMSKRRVSVYAYKSGYHPRHSPRFDVFDIPMEKNRDSYDKRFAELKRLVPSAGCLGANNGEVALYPFYKAMAEDAAKYATTYEERKDIRWFQEIAAGMLVDEPLEEDYQRKVEEILKKGLP